MTIAGEGTLARHPLEKAVKQATIGDPGDLTAYVLGQLPLDELLAAAPTSDTADGGWRLTRRGRRGRPAR